MSSLSGIQGLTLSGFQVFDSLTEIPLAKLTLLFGPNSAGKSAVEDALKILPKLWETPHQYVDKKQLDEDILRHWRRSGKTDGELAPNMVINASLHCWVDIDECFSIETGRSLAHESFYQQESSQISNLELKTTLTTRPSIYSLISQVSESKIEFESKIELQEIYAEGALLIRSSASEGITINFSHSALRHLRVNSDYQAIAKEFNDHLAFVEGLVILKKRQALDLGTWGRRSMSPSTARGIEMSAPMMSQTTEDIQDHRFASECSYAIEEFFLYVDTLALNIFAAADLGMDLVSASRHVPSTSDLTCLVGGSGKSDQDPRFLVSGDSRFDGLASSFVSYIRSSPSEDADVSVPSREPVFEVVNRYLTDYLFIDRGYQLNFSYRFISPPYAQTTHISEIDLNEMLLESDVLVTTSLTDASGARFRFEDVGSGLGYVLPILTAIAEPYSPHVVVLQQPELHLHPALQSVMGDVLIDGANRCGSVIAETHSEHLLLRILKRIRQTHSGAIVDPHQSIRADEVSVLYFDPKPDGSTTVKQLRISEDGDFLDMWPRGFFTERDRELFDE